MSAPFGTSWPPDYTAVYADRVRRATKLRESPDLQHQARFYYAARPVEFIEHWCVTYDPRNAGTGKPSKMPFILFDRQREFVAFLQACLEAQTDGLCEKSRDMGMTWICCAFAVWLWLYKDGAAVGFGSRKSELVDRLGDPDSIFEKMRIIIRSLPPWMLPVGFDIDRDMGIRRIVNPATGATITGEIGDNIGRGGRKLMVFKDESAHYERPEMIEAALGDNTNVQIDISSVNGLGNVFHRRRENGIEWSSGAADPDRTNVFIADWRHHPAKTQEWYDRRRRKAESDGLLTVFAQEVDRDYSAAVEGIIIPAKWVSAAIDAHIRLGWGDGGLRLAGLDVADEGGDLNGYAERHGSVVTHLHQWGEGDTGQTTRKSIEIIGPRAVTVNYDATGVGAGVKAEANRLKGDDLVHGGIKFVAWHGGAGVLFPDDPVVPGAKPDESPVNKDFYQNLTAQAWWELRRRFERTYQAVEQGASYDISDMISLPSDLPFLDTLRKELSQPTYKMSASLKMMVEKKPPGTRSPNLADSVKMAFWPNVEAIDYNELLRTAVGI